MSRLERRRCTPQTVCGMHDSFFDHFETQASRPQKRQAMLSTAYEKCGAAQVSSCCARVVSCVVGWSQTTCPRLPYHTSDRSDDLSLLDDLNTSGKICMVLLMMAGGSRTISMPSTCFPGLDMFTVCTDLGQHPISAVLGSTVTDLDRDMSEVCELLVCRDWSDERERSWSFFLSFRRYRSAVGETWP